MKRYLVLLLALVLLSGCTTAPQPTEPPKPQYVMTEANYQFPNGNSMRMVYHLDEQWRVCGYTTYRNGATEGETTSYTFDEHGYTILETTVSGTETHEAFTVNTYDDEGRRIRAEQDRVTMDYTYEDGHLATLTQVQDLDINGVFTTVTHYNANGDITFSETTGNDGSVPSSVTQTFDENGRLLKTVQVQYGTDRTETVPEYDDQGRIVKSTQTYSNAEGEAYMTLVNTYTYSDDGLVCTKITTEGDRETAYQVTTCDQVGNVLKDEFGRADTEGYYYNTFTYLEVPGYGA